MKANELRIGNWIEEFENGIGFKNIQVSTDDFKMVEYHNDKGLDRHEGYYSAIQLTEEWLIKFGFEEHKSTMDLLWDYTVCLERQHNELFVVNIDNIHIYKIDYVHQLQNLYFALTGEELTIKE